jgi:hypothetical protein
LFSLDRNPYETAAIEISKQLASSCAESHGNQHVDQLTAVSIGYSVKKIAAAINC